MKLTNLRYLRLANLVVKFNFYVKENVLNYYLFNKNTYITILINTFLIKKIIDIKGITIKIIVDTYYLY